MEKVEFFETIILVALKTDLLFIKIKIHLTKYGKIKK